MATLLTPYEQCIIEEAKRRVSLTWGTEVTPLKDSVLTWQQYQAKWWRNDAPNSDAHNEMWEFFDGLEQGIKPVEDSLVEVINRGGGKSTTIEKAVTWTGVKATRKFWLYVCSVQEAADKHVGAIGAHMERQGIDRKISKYGVAEGWSADKLRCDNGFNVLGIGLLDAASRGLKLDDFRPDGIILDDMDVSGETAFMTDKKLNAIKKAILPSGSTDCVYVFIQNLINANGIMAQVLDGRADMLHNRKPTEMVPAVYDLKTEKYFADGKTRHRIVSGTPSWPGGKPLEVCQQEIDTFGYEAFMQENQHDVYRTGVFFTNYSEEQHIRRVNYAEGVCKACLGEERAQRFCLTCEGTGEFIPAPLPIPVGWKFFGGLDYGRSEQNPFAFLLFAVNYDGDVKVIDEIYEAQISPEDQAQKVVDLITGHGQKLQDVKIFGDPSFFGKQQAAPSVTLLNGVAARKARPIPGWSMFTNSGKHVSDIYIGAGLYVVPAMGSNSRTERINGWASLNQYLDKQNAFVVYEGRCPNFVRQIKNAPKDPNDSYDVDTHSEDHLLDCARFFTRNRNLVAKPRQEELPSTAPKWMKQAFNKKSMLKL